MTNPGGQYDQFDNWRVGWSGVAADNAAIEHRWRRLSTDGGVLYLVEDVTAWREAG